MIGRYVKLKGKPWYNTKVGGIYQILKEESSNWIIDKYASCDKSDLLEEFELMPEDYNPNKVNLIEALIL